MAWDQFLLFWFSLPCVPQFQRLAIVHLDQILLSQNGHVQGLGGITLLWSDVLDKLTSAGVVWVWLEILVVFLASKNFGY